MARRVHIVPTSAGCAAASSGVGVAAVTVRTACLVVGNWEYEGEVAPLPNPQRDAKAVHGLFRALGFDSTLVENADRETLAEAINELGAKLSRDREVRGVFFFAGHGVQVEGHNYLVPIRAKLTGPSKARFQLLAVDEVLATVQDARNDFNLVVLDACRNDPFARSRAAWGGGATRGLVAQQSHANGVVIAFATGPGDVAQDGPRGRHSPFAEGLLQHIGTPGVCVTSAFKRVAKHVQEATGGKQIPYQTHTLTDDFVLVPTDGGTLAQAPINGNLPAFNSAREEKYIVAYDFHPNFDDELSVLKGDVVIVTEKNSDGIAWFTVRRVKDGRVGLVPSNYLRPYSTATSAAPSPAVAVGVPKPPGYTSSLSPSSSLMLGAANPGRSRDEVELNDILAAMRADANVVNQHEQPGTIEPPPQHKWFHGKMTRVVAEALLVGNGNLPAFNSASEEKYIVAYDFHTNFDDELSVLKGDVVIVTEKISDAWFTARRVKDGRVGLVPSNYLQPYSTATSAAPSPAVAVGIPKPPGYTSSLSPSSSLMLGAANPGRSRDEVELNDILAAMRADANVVYQHEQPGTIEPPPQHKWFHGKMTRVVAEALLVGKGREGSYLIRESTSQSGDYSLSFRVHNGVVKHFHIVNEGGDFNIGGSRFHSLIDLVRYYCNTYVSDDLCLQYPLMPEGQIYESGVRKVVVALYDYKAALADELSFRKGDTMSVLDDNDSNWWWARKNQAGGGGAFVVGYIPSTLVEEI